MSHCFVIGRVPILSMQSPRNNCYTIQTLLTLDDDTEYKATLSVYVDFPPQEKAVFEIEAAYANNGGADIQLGSDHKQMELLGSGSPPDESYLASCPEIGPPRFNVLGTVASPDSSLETYSFTLAGTSYIDTGVQAGNQPFMIKVHVDRVNTCWSKFHLPSVGQTVCVGGRLMGRERDDQGLLIIDLAHITYISSGPHSSSTRSPSKALPTKSGSGWARNQREAKRKRKEDDDEDGGKKSGHDQALNQASSSTAV
ncbi:hypothetical protein B0H14DRAFT_3623846 [Mycena olivaceomarginata]|nr:hypothetical protein B0H14DRAFT_3623846 [Mycena olivaceomarginata]